PRRYRALNFIFSPLSSADDSLGRLGGSWCRRSRVSCRNCEPTGTAMQGTRRGIALIARPARFGGLMRRLRLPSRVRIERVDGPGQSPEWEAREDRRGEAAGVHFEDAIGREK